MKNWLKDTAERAIASFLEAFLTIVIAANTTWFNLSTIRAAAVAGGVAAFTVIKAALANIRPGTMSPASAVKPADG